MPIHSIAWLGLLSIILFSNPSLSSECFRNFSPNIYPSCSQLSPNVSMHWATVNGAITFALDLDGVWDWVGIGISEGGMLGADLAVAMHDIDAHRWIAADYWSTSFNTPQLDNQQDVSLIFISRQLHNNLHSSTLVAMRRALVTCDPAGQDRPILNNTRQTVVFAYGTDAFSYHGPTNRGQAELVLLPSTSTQQRVATGRPPAGPPLETRDLLMPRFSVPTAPTTYQCVNLELPANAKYHIYSYEPVIDNSKLVHHFIVYSCRGNSPPNTTIGQTYDCLHYMECEDFFMGWAPGLGKVDTPAAAALAFGNGTNTLYVTLQIHYTNIEGLTNQTDSSGFRISFSPILKPYDMGFLTLGSVDIAVPPGDSTWSTPPNICPSSCTAKLAAKSAGSDGLVLVDSFYHMHQLGRSMVTRHVRNGVELPPLGSREFFAFDYQSPVNIPPGARELLPNDTLITTCTYRGSGRTNTTKYGLASYDEMCFNFVLYYPYNPDITECMEYDEAGIATCTNSDVLRQIENDEATFDAAVQAGQMVPVPKNFTYRPYQPICVRSAPKPTGVNGGSGGTVSDSGVDKDEDNDRRGEEQQQQHDQQLEERRRRERNVGGAVAAILLVTAGGAVAIAAVYRVMKKRKQLEEEQHLFEKYNPNSILVPVLGADNATTNMYNSSTDPNFSGGGGGGSAGGGDRTYGKDTYGINKSGALN